MRTYVCCLLMLSFASLAHAQSDSKPAPSDQQKSAASTTAPQLGENNAQANEKAQEKHASQKDNALAQDKDKIYDSGKNGVTPPVAVHIENPEMPEQLRRAHLKDGRGNKGKRFIGTLILGGYIDKNGRPHDLKILRSLSKETDNAALNAVTGWKFRPCTLHGRPVNCHFAAEISFNLH